MTPTIVTLDLTAYAAHHSTCMVCKDTSELCPIGAALMEPVMEKLITTGLFESKVLEEQVVVE